MLHLLQQNLYNMRYKLCFLGILLFSSLSCFSQINERKLIDSVLVKKLGMSYQDYTNGLQQKENSISKEWKKAIGRKTKGAITKPSRSSLIYSKNYPLVLVNEKSIYPSIKSEFKKIKKVTFSDGKDAKIRAIYGDRAKYGVYFIEVE